MALQMRLYGMIDMELIAAGMHEALNPGPSLGNVSDSSRIEN